MCQRIAVRKFILKNVKTHNLFVDLGPGLVKDIESEVWIADAFDPETTPVPPHPFLKVFKAIWDTGAQGTAIHSRIAKLFHLEIYGSTNVHGVTGCRTCNTYLISLHLPNGIIIPELEVDDCDEDIGCDVLIGMDVITLGDFAISNLFGNTTFTFRIPSVECINFTNQLPRSAVRGRFVNAHGKVGRNAKCPCGSGKKYKKCCGK